MICKQCNNANYIRDISGAVKLTCRTGESVNGFSPACVDYVDKSKNNNKDGGNHA